MNKIICWWKGHKFQCDSIDWRGVVTLGWGFRPEPEFEFKRSCTVCGRKETKIGLLPEERWSRYNVPDAWEKEWKESRTE